MDSADNTHIMHNRGSAGKLSRGGTGAIPRKRITADQVTNTLRQAQSFQTQGRFNDALDLCEQILESGVDRPDVRYFLGCLYQEQRRWDDAICQFQMLSNDPDYALSSYYALGQCYCACGDLRTATTHFDEAIDQVDLDTVTIEEADQFVQLCQEAAEAHNQLGEQEQALTVYNALLAFLRSRGWSNKVAQVESILKQLQNNLSPRPEARSAPAPVAPQPQKHSPSQHVRQQVTRLLSAISSVPEWLHTVFSKQQAVLITISLILLVGISLGGIGTGIWFYVVYQNPHSTPSTVVHPSKTTPHPNPTVSRILSPTPSSTATVNIAGSYYGTLHDIPTNLTTNISLTNVRQQQGNISGYFGGMPTNRVFNGIPQNGPFTGTISTAKQIHFIVMNNTGQATFSFTGLMQPDGTLAGTYCGLEATTGNCSDYGLWSVSPGT